MHRHLILALSLISLLASSTALAQQASVTADDNSVPSFATMDRGDAHSKFGFAVARTFVDSNDSITATRFDLHGQYVHPKGFGFYGSLPFSHLKIDLGPTDEFSGMALGNIEVGVLHNRRLHAQALLTLRAGLVLPTGNTGDRSLATGLSFMPRMTDISGMFPDTTVARMSVSVTGKRSAFFYRVDAGLDLPRTSAENMGIDPLVRLNVGAGAEAGAVALMGEFVSVGSTAGDVSQNFMHTASLSASLTADAKLQPIISVILPVNGIVSSMFDASVMLSVQGRLQ